MEGIQYDLISMQNLGTQNGWDQFELVFSVKKEGVSNNEVFAKMTIQLNVLNEEPSESKNCTISLWWKTIRDEHGNLLVKEIDTWAYSDFLKIPFKVNHQNCEKLGKTLAEKLLPGRLDLRSSLQNATYEVLKQVA